MAAIKVLAFDDGGRPRMLSNMNEIEAAIADKRIAADTRVTLYLTEGGSRQAAAQDHPELSAFFRPVEPDTAPVADPEPSVDDRLEALTREIEAGSGSGTPLPAAAEAAARRERLLQEARSMTGEAPRTTHPAGPTFGASAHSVFTEHLPNTQLASEKPFGDMHINTDGAQFFDLAMMPLRRYADFNGRSRRMEYWAWFVCWLVGAVGVSIVSENLLPIYWLVTIIPHLAVTVRRLHDSGLSGWTILVSLIPFIGWIPMLVLMLIDSAEGTNQYGPNPKTGA